MPQKKKAEKKQAVPASLIIRPARPSDRPAIEALAGQLFPRATPAFGPTDHYFVARLGGRLAGWVHLRERMHSVLLQGLAVHPSFRRRGIGQALLRLALRQCARRQPGHPVALKVRAANAPALSLYLREGFSLHSDSGASYLLKRLPPN